MLLKSSVIYTCECVKIIYLQYPNTDTAFKAREDLKRCVCVAEELEQSAGGLTVHRACILSLLLGICTLRTENLILTFAKHFEVHQ